MDHSFDDDAVGLDGDESDGTESVDTENVEALESLQSVLSAIQKVSCCFSSDMHGLISSG